MPPEGGGGDEVTSSDASAPARRWPVVGAWLAFVGVCLLLDGLIGVAVALVAAAVVAARLPARVLGAFATAAALGALVTVLVGGVPAEVDVSPRFVSRSLVPHHLMFAAMAWASAWVVLDLIDHLRVAARAEPVAEPSGAPDRRVAIAVVAVVAVGALAASAAVLWG